MTLADNIGNVNFANYVSLHYVGILVNKYKVCVRDMTTKVNLV